MARVQRREANRGRGLPLGARLVLAVRRLRVVFENIDQGIARDVLAVKMLKFEEMGIEIEGHAHDEGIGETANDAFTPGVAEMIAEMSQPVEWAPGLLLGADGFEGQYYHK